MASPSTSRFEELPDDPPSPPPAVEAATHPLPATPRAQSAPTDDEVEGSDGDDDEDAPETWWTPSELRDLLEHAQQLKQQGNTEFGQGRWEMALETYREGLNELPIRKRSSAKGKEKALPADAEPEKSEGNAAQEGDLDEEAESEELSELRAILSANVAACLLKLVRSLLPACVELDPDEQIGQNRWKDAVKACDDALEDKPGYTKAIHRRALANEAIGSWGSLSSALEDFNKLAALPDNSPLLADQIKQAQARLPKKIEKQQEKEKEEVVGKLKDLGNMVLGKFGLSTDNFKMVEQPGGGYSVNFSR
ncbi:hypothetical protein Rhopal_002544-T1 [Rhodotorula paludigena]|uniref:Tetratricopeptide repeat protein 1 n=1 Tax=Rhodotorula paludigena TaxID=86838 RepID=A0AAV5GKJ2_9BASI|nr:hypothetical protein Rhopal_002544-T1 [Rhodotorula paludigena]